MTNIIEAISNAVETYETATECKELAIKLSTLLDQGAAVASLPISVVNQHSRIKSPAFKESVLHSSLYNQDGKAHDRYTLSDLTPFVQKYPKLFQTIDIAITNTKALEEITFASKRPNDYWKRLNDCEAIQAMMKVSLVEQSRCLIASIEQALQASSNGQWSIESDLRDDMRSKKENPLLRHKPYIALYSIIESSAESDGTIKAMLRHYFKENVFVKEGENSYFIGFSATLDEVSLRTFYKKRI